MDSIQLWRKDLQDYLHRMLPFHDPISQLLDSAVRDLHTHARPVLAGTLLPLPPRLGELHHRYHDLPLDDGRAGMWTMTEAIARRLDGLDVAAVPSSHNRPLFIDIHDFIPLPLTSSPFSPFSLSSSSSSSYSSSSSSSSSSLSPSSLDSSSSLRSLSKWTLHDRARFLPMIQVPPWRPSIQTCGFFKEIGNSDLNAVRMNSRVCQRLVTLDAAWRRHRSLDPVADEQDNDRFLRPPEAIGAFEFAALAQASTKEGMHADPMPGLERAAAAAAERACGAHPAQKRKSSPNSRDRADMRFSATKKVSDFVSIRKSSTSVLPSSGKSPSL